MTTDVLVVDTCSVSRRTIFFLLLFTMSWMTSMGDPMLVVDSVLKICFSERELGLINNMWDIPAPSEYFYCDDSASFILLFKFSVSADR
jgi:hypothetical protein